MYIDLFFKNINFIDAAKTEAAGKPFQSFMIFCEK